MLFVIGLVLLCAGLFAFQPRAVVVHPQWSYDRVCSALRDAPNDAVVRILQTWFPYESFIPNLRDFYLHHGKKFELHVLLMDPGTDTNVPSDLLAARVLLRGVSPVDAAKEVRFTREHLIRMKAEVERHRKLETPGARRVNEVDLEVRYYDFMPFGPIYQIGDDVIYCGLYLNFGTSAECFMLEVRNTPGNRVWKQLKKQFDDGWSAGTSRIEYPLAHTDTSN